MWIPPGEWPEIAQIYAITSRHYQVAKTAEWGNMNFEPFSPEDYAVETGFILACAMKVVENGAEPISPEIKAQVSEWVIKTANEWLVKRGKNEGIEVRECEGGCGRVTATDENGRFLCMNRYEGHGE